MTSFETPSLVKVKTWSPGCWKCRTNTIKPEDVVSLVCPPKPEPEASIEQDFHHWRPIWSLIVTLTEKSKLTETEFTLGETSIEVNTAGSNVKVVKPEIMSGLEAVSWKVPDMLAAIPANVATPFIVFCVKVPEKSVEVGSSTKLIVNGPYLLATADPELLNTLTTIWK